MGIIIEQYNITIGDIKDMDFITELNALLGIILFLIILYCINKLLKRVFDIKTFKGKLFCLVATIIIMSILYALFEKPIKYIEGNFVFLYLSTATIIAYTVHKVIRFQIFHKKKYSISQLDYMEGHQFECACADILKANAFKNVTVTQGSGDFGVDILAEKNGYKYAIQCKRYSHKLDNKPIQEVIGGLAYYGCTKGAVMTNQYFTEPAKKLAKINGVELWDRNILQKMSYAHSPQNEKLDRPKNFTADNTEPTYQFAATKEDNLEHNSNVNENETFSDEYVAKKNINLKYSNYSTLLTDLEENQKIYQEYIVAVATNIITYFNTSEVYIHLENIDIKFDTNEVIFEFTLKEQTRISQVKKLLKEIAKYVGVKYVEYVYPTSTPYTIGLKVPLPDYLKQTSTFVYECSK